jgi:hypothetical protein
MEILLGGAAPWFLHTSHHSEKHRNPRFERADRGLCLFQRWSQVRLKPHPKIVSSRCPLAQPSQHLFFLLPCALSKKEISEKAPWSDIIERGMS